MWHNMSQEVESVYDHCIADLNALQANVDPTLLIRVMHLERRLPDESPLTEIEITYKQGVDKKQKEDQMRGRGFQTSHHNDDLFVVGRMNIDKICRIAADSDIEMIHGQANPCSY